MCRCIQLKTIMVNLLIRKVFADSGSLESQNYSMMNMICTGKAKYIDYPLMDTWNFVEHSFRGVDSVLNFEKQLSNDWPDDKKYVMRKEDKVMKVYSADFSKEYSKRLNGMQERRMKALRNL